MSRDYPDTLFGISEGVRVAIFLNLLVDNNSQSKRLAIATPPRGDKKAPRN